MSKVENRETLVSRGREQLAALWFRRRGEQVEKSVSDRSGDLCSSRALAALWPRRKRKQVEKSVSDQSGDIFSSRMETVGGEDMVFERWIKHGNIEHGKVSGQWEVEFVERDENSDFGPVSPPSPQQSCPPKKRTQGNTRLRLASSTP